MTREREWENRRKRSWTPAMVRSTRGKKKAAGNAAHQQGDECVEGAGVPATPPSSISRRCRGHRLRTAKKRGVFPKHPRVRRIAPSPKKQSNDDVRFSDWSSLSRQNDGCGQQPKKKTGSLAATGRNRLSGAFWCRPLRQLCFNPRHDRNRPQQNRHGVRTACVVYLLACFSHCNGFPRDLLMRSTSRRLALDHRFASTVLWSLFAALIFQALGESIGSSSTQAINNPSGQ